MRTTIALHDDLVDEDRKATGNEDKTDLIHAGLQALIDREKERRSAALGGLEPELRIPRRRRSA